MMAIMYTIVRLLPAFEFVKLPEGEEKGVVGRERQRLTLVLSCAEGCRVEVESRKGGKDNSVCQ